MYKQLSRFFLLVSLCFSLASCSKDRQEIAGSSSSQNPDVIPIEEALANLDNVMAKLYGDTRSEGQRTYDKSSIEVLRKSEILSETRAEESAGVPDSLLYLVNFDDDKGFAVLSASRKLSEDIYCVTEAGSLSVEDLSAAAARMSADTRTRSEYADSSDNIVSCGKDFVPQLIAGAVILESVYNVKPEEDSSIDTRVFVPIDGPKYGPFLKTKWGQRKKHKEDSYLFNRYTPNHAPAGCVAIATAQIMEYWKHPSNPVFWEKSCDWDGMETVYNYQTVGENEDTTYYDQVACFVRSIGKHDSCRIKYGDSENDGSGGVAEGAQRALQKYGYRDVDKHLGFGSKNQGIADKCIRGGRPVFLAGKGNGAHAWVIDGLWGNYYHVNWGWYGVYDGYFKKGVFKLTDRYVIDEIDSGDDNQKPYNFTNTYRLVTYGSGFKN